MRRPRNLIPIGLSLTVAGLILPEIDKLGT